MRQCVNCGLRGNRNQIKEKIVESLLDSNIHYKINLCKHCYKKKNIVCRYGSKIKAEKWEVIDAKELFTACPKCKSKKFVNCSASRDGITVKAVGCANNDCDFALKEEEFLKLKTKGIVLLKSSTGSKA